MAKFRGRFLKNKDIAISKKDRANGDDAMNTSEFAKDAAPEILKDGTSLKTATPSLRHAITEELKRIDSDS